VATKTLRAAGGDFSTPESWVASLPATFTEDEVIEIYDDWPAGVPGRFFLTGIDPNGFNITIKAATGEGNDGVFGQGVLMSNTTTHWAENIRASVANVHIENIRFSRTRAGACVRLDANVSSSCSLSKCFITSTYNSYALEANRTKVTNTVVYDCPLGVECENWYAPNLYNVLIRDCTIGILVGAGSSSESQGSDIINTCLYNCTTDVSGNLTHHTGFTHHNATSKSSDTVGGDGLGTDLVLNVAASDFVDAANDDFHLSSGSALKDTGADNSSILTDDILGSAWVVPWDIGPYQYVATGGGVTGDLNATEPATDTFSAVGSSAVTGDLNATEPATDTFISGKTDEDYMRFEGTIFINKFNTEVHQRS